MSELKPCPFCGGEAKTRLDDRWWVHCGNCTCEIGFEGMDENGYSGHFDTEAEAIDAWNTRAERTCEQIDVTEMHKPFTTHMTECSECGGVLAVDEMPAPNYCPNCGAKVER